MPAMPQVKQLAAEFKGQPVVVLGMNTDRDEEDAKFVVDKMKFDYAIDRPTGPSAPTSIQFELPKPLEWAGDWKNPEPTLDEAHPEEPSFIYQGSVTFQRQVRVARDVPPGQMTLQGSLHYQACNKVSCRAPTQLTLETNVNVLP